MECRVLVPVGVKFYKYTKSFVIHLHAWAALYSVYASLFLLRNISAKSSFTFFL